MKINFINLRFLIIGFLMIQFIHSHAVDVIIGTSTTSGSNSAVPFYGYYGNSWGAMVYTQAEIGMVGNITSIQFQKSNTNTDTYTNQKIYMAIVNDSYFSNSTYINPTSIGATLVYDGSISYTSTIGFQGVNLQNSFAYTGGNLLVLYENRHGSNYLSYPTWYYTNTSDIKSKYYYSSGSFPTGSGYTTTNRPNTKFSINYFHPIDLKLSEWVYPNNGSSASSSMPISIKVKNEGSQAQSNYTVKYSINNGATWFSQNISANIAIGATANITFIQPANMSTPGTYQCIAVVNKTGDGNTSNDTLRQSIVICGGGYAGSYTIGNGSSDDFPNLDLAFLALRNCGMNSSVTLKVKPGTYVGQIDIPFISGLSTSKTLTIETYTGLKDVVFTYSGTSSNHLLNYTMSLDSARFVTLKNLTIKASGSNGVHALLVDKASNNLIQNCVFEGDNNTTSTTFDNSTVLFNHVSGAYSVQNRFVNNTIKYGSYGVYNYGTSGYVYGNKYDGNNVLDYRNSGFYIYYNDSVQITNNLIKTSYLYPTNGIYVGQCQNNVLVSSNKLELNYGIGIYMYYSQNTSAYPGKVINNWIYGSPTVAGTYYATNIYYCNYLEVEHNSFYLTNPNSLSFTSYGFYMYYGSYNTFRNNSLVNEAGGYSTYIYNTSFAALNNNNYYSSGSYIAYYNGNRTNLAALKSYNTSFNQNSISSNGVYYSSTNLHSNSSSLNNLGSALSTVSVDIDGQARSTTTPDIGADEFDIMSYDCGLESFTGLTAQCGGTLSPLYVTLKNYGTQVVTSAKIKTKINNSLQSQNWSGYLSPGGTANVFVGTYTFSSDTVYNLTSYVDTVNNVVDMNHYNDTVSFIGYRTSLSGSFIIGASSTADFADISEAISALKSYGVCGPVIFNIESGIYSGNYSIVSAITGMSQTNTVTFRSLTGDTADVRLNYNALSSADNYVFNIENTGYFNFKGITFINNNNNYSTLFELDYASNILIDSCLLIMAPNSTSSYNNGVLASYSNGISVTNSSIYNGMYGMRFNGLSSSYSNGIYLANNIIKDFEGYGIYLSYVDTVTIKNNVIQSVAMANSVVYPIYINRLENYLDLNSNKITANTNNYSYGIYLYYINYNYQNNYSNLRVYNNFVNVNSSSSTTSLGIYNNYTYYLKLYFNSVRLSSVNTTSSAYYAYYAYYSALLNNNLYASNGYAYYRYYGYVNQSDYNNFYSDGTYFARYNSTYYNNLTSFKSGTGGDTYSKNVAPGFLSATDLHVFNAALNDAGTPISGITKDIDGETRSLYLPDIGADEFTIVARDVYPFAVNSPKNPAAIGQNHVKVAIKNQGTSPLYSAKIFAQLDGGVIDSVYWVGSLALLEIDSLIPMASVNLTSGNHVLKVWTKGPNGQADLNPSNDTLVYSFSAIPKPVIDVEPSILVDTIYSCSGTSINAVKIINRGSANLTYTIPANYATSDSIKILAILTGYSSTYYTNTKSIITGNIPKVSIAETFTESATTLESLLDGKNIVLIPRLTGTASNILNAYTSFGPVLQNFVNNGGSVIFMGTQSTAANNIFNTGLFSGYYNGYMSTGYTLVKDLPTSPIFKGLEATTMVSNYYYAYYSITNTDATMIMSYASTYPIIIERSIGKGKVMLMGQDNYYYGTQETTLLKNAINYLHNPQDFVVNSLQTQTVPAGDTATVNITFNSNGLTNGWHVDKFVINHNDQSQSSLIVPCSLFVDGEPIIGFNKTYHSFGAVYQGVAVIDSIYFKNVGCDDLIVSNITTSNAYLTALKTSDTIAPGDSTAFYFKFLPLATGSYVMTATVQNNDAVQTLNFAGSATPSPAISLSPNPIVATITNCNDSIIVPVTITNTGGATLTGTVTPSSDSLNVLMLTYGVYTSYVPNLIDALDYSFTKFNLTQSTASTTTQLQAALVDQDVVIIPYISSTSYYSVYTSFNSILQNFVQSGGIIIYGGQYYPTYLTSAGFFSGSYIGYEDYVNVTVNTNHALTNGFTASTYIGNEDFLYYTFTGSGRTDLINYGSYNVSSITPYGNGYAIYLGFYYPSYSTQFSHMIASNSLQFAYDRKSYWISHASTSFNVSPGNSTQFNVKLKSSGMQTGQYTSSIQFNTNVPSSSVVNLPCTLNVRNELNAGSFLGPDTSYCGPTLLNAGSGYSTYQWNTSSTSQTLLANTSGYYMVTITDGAYCSSRDTVLLTIKPIPNAVITGLPINACTNGTPIQMVGSPAGGGFIGNGVSGTTFNPSSVSTGPHNITYTFTNSYGCTDSDVKTVTVSNPPTVLLSGLASSYCPNGSSSTLIGAPAGGLFSGAGVSGNVFNPVNAGSGNKQVIYSYTDANGCNNKDTLFTVVHPHLQAVISGYNSDVCINSAAMTLSSSVAGTVFSGNGVNGNLFNPSVAGVGVHYINYSYSDVVNNCSYVDSIQIIVRALPTGVTLSGLSSDYCLSEGNVTLSGYPLGGSFLGNGVSGNVFNTQNAGAGNHVVVYEYTDVYGCSNYDSVIVTINPLPVITFSNINSSYCLNNGNVNLSATPTGGLFSGNAVTGTTFNPLNAGVGSHYIHYAVMDNNFCMAQDSIMVVINALPTVSFTGLPSTICSNGTSVTLSGTPQGGSFTGPGVSGLLFNPKNAGAAGLKNIVYNYTDNNGCSNQAQNSVTVLQVQTVNIGPDQQITNNSTTQFNTIVAGGTGSFTYNWQPANLLVNPAILNPTTVPITQTAVFSLAVTDNNTQCVNSDTAIVTVSGGAVTVVVSATNTDICSGVSTQLNAVGSGGNGNYSYSWSSIPLGFSSSQASPIVSPSVTTTYSCQVSDGTYTANQSVVITVKPSPDAQISNLNTSYCTNDAEVALVATPSGGVFSGSGINGNVFNPAMASIGLNQISYSVTSANGCSDVETIAVEVKLAPTASAGSDTILPCQNNGVQLGQQPFANVSYNWFPSLGLNNANIANPVSTPNYPITYIFTATATNGCVATDTVNITVNGGPVAIVSNDTMICAGEVVNLSVSGGDSYLWSTGDTTTTIQVSPMKTTQYFVVTSQSNCADMDTILVTVNNPNPRLGKDTVLCAQNSILVSPGIFSSYLWSTGSIAPFISIDSAGIGLNSTQVSVQVTDNYGCTNSDTIVIGFQICIGMIDNQPSDLIFTLYPNPSKGRINLISTPSSIQKFKYSIVDLTGKIMEAGEFVNVTGQFNEQMDLSHLAKGVYLINLIGDNHAVTMRITIQ